MKILVLNCGSSSVKYMVYDWNKKYPLVKGVVERVVIGDSFVRHQVTGKEEVIKRHECPDHKEAIKLVIDMLTHKDVGVIKDLKEIEACGHRVVHGGEKFNRSVLITEDVIRTFEELSDLAPLHNPPNVLGIKAAMEILPDIPHVAIMDTAFHQTIPPHAYIYAVPYEWYERYGIRRYGFHGTSHLYVSRRAAVLLKKNINEVNLITCHIGNGASVAAIRNGVSVDTSMGFTPLEGLVMGTRSGDLDPAIVAYIVEKEKITAQRVIDILNKKSGILGITGKYVDRRDVMKAAKEGDERAKLAFEIECYRLKKYIGAYMAVLGNVDAIVFTAGVGEKGWELREKVLSGLEIFGIKLDEEKNKKAVSRNHEFDISAENSKVKIFVIPTDEEIVYVEDVVAIIEHRYSVYTKYKYSFESPDYVNILREEAYRREIEGKKE